MSDAFADALDAIYDDDNSAIAALWKQGGVGAGVACRIVRPLYRGNTSSPLALDARRAPYELRVRRSEVPAVAAGDTFTVIETGRVLTARHADPDEEEIEWVVLADSE